MTPTRPGAWKSALRTAAWGGLRASAALHARASRVRSDTPAPADSGGVRSICLFAAISNRDNPHVPGLGDLISKNAFLKVLRDAYPDARLYCAAGATLLRRYRHFLLRHAYIDDVVECPESDAARIRDWAAFFRRMRRERFDLCVIDPSSVTLRGLHAYLCGIPERIGVPFDAHEARFLSRSVALDFASPQGMPDLLDSTRAFAAAIGARRLPEIADLIPRFPYTPVAHGHPVADRLVAVHVGGDAHWNRRWPLDHYRELCSRLCRREGIGVRLVGGDGETPEIRALCEAVSAENPQADILDLSGGTLDAMASTIDRASLFVGNDSAPLHIAAALGKPVIVPCGPIGSELWERLYAARVVRLDYGCHRPSAFAAQRHVRREFSCAEFRCGYGYDPAAPTYPRCLSDIGVDHVWNEIEAWLGAASADGGAS